MFKLAVIVLLIGAAAASGIGTLPIRPTVFPSAVADVVPNYYGGALGNAVDGIDSLGLAYTNADLNDGRVLGLRVGGFGYGLGGFGYGAGYGLGGLGYGFGFGR